jgi:hypothetical protein
MRAVPTDDTRNAVDPIAFRLRIIEDPRLRRLLEAVKQQSG